eukprot:CAMPEP_0197414548 /NCGR_PEP_ID=MMETSP1170-20131217/1249_1 /TAXON_ID=54406 /ORGANISM="Sarcinochrysis sp, Strain CCMP770" /LENGTH=55 /DNA_ID=CAMNT_0042941269 /DNA_START=6 /DNA_END=170 /DNA_ORIENTATION=-
MACWGFLVTGAVTMRKIRMVLGQGKYMRALIHMAASTAQAKYLTNIIRQKPCDGE